MTAWLSILGIGVAIAVGYARRVNIGLIAIGLAFVIGHFAGGLPPGQIVSGWPLNLFFMLLGMTLLFGMARVNGTLGWMAERVVAATRGRRALIPPVFFGLSGVLAALGAGNISVCALLLPIAMTIASRYRVSPLLMATMVIAGANAGGLSPIAPTGIIAATLAREQGLDLGFLVFTRQIIGQAILAAVLYFLLHGHQLTRVDFSPKPSGADAPDARGGLTRTRLLTMAVFGAVIGAILFGGWDLGLTAFSGAVILLLAGAADERRALEAVPWDTLILVSGVGMLVRVAESAGGIQLLADALARWMNEGTAPAILAVIGGLLSILSSASGVVMPTLIPAVPEMVARVGGDPVQMISAIVLGAHVVTNSPISTLGALAMSAAGPDVDKGALFRNLLLLALAGLGYAALIVYLGIA